MQRETRIVNYVLGALMALSFVLLSLPLSTPVRSFKAAAAYVLNPLAYHGEIGYVRIAHAPERIGRLLSADIENVRLREELQHDQWLKTTIESLSLENERLRRVMALKAPQNRYPIWAHVMEREPLHWYRSLVIDAGLDQGISLNDSVLGPHDGRLVAVGRIVDVRANTSTVLLLTDELSAAAAYLSSGTHEGLVQGQDGPYLRMNYLNSEAQLSVGDFAYTSPTSATFPPDVLIGQVIRVNPRDPFLFFQSVDISPTAHASALQKVMILRVRSPQTAAINVSSGVFTAPARPNTVPVKAGTAGVVP